MDTLQRVIEARFGADSQAGAALAEYGLLVVLIAVVCFAAVSLLGVNITAGFTQAAGGI